MTIAAAAAALLAAAAAGPASAQTPRTCTWGGTPPAPTGQNAQHPGVTNTPSTGPLRFHASGPLGGGCSGTFTFDGIEDTGASCGLIRFRGTASGIPGVARFAGVSVGGLAPARLYDSRGRLVGTETAQFLTNAPFSDCNTPDGLTHNNFSSVIQLFDLDAGTIAPPVG